MFRLLLVAAILSGGCSAKPEPSPAEPPIEQSRVSASWTLTSATLYLPTSITERRITSEALGAYLVRVKEAAEAAFSEEDRRPGVSGTLVVMLKPGRQARFWIVTGDPLDDAVGARILTHIELAPPPSVEGGPVVVGLHFDAWGGGTQPANMPYPVPDSWRALMPAGGVRMDDAFLAKVWPD